MIYKLGDLIEIKKSGKKYKIVNISEYPDDGVIVEKDDYWYLVPFKLINDNRSDSQLSKDIEREMEDFNRSQLSRI